jgi:hypothetical protein
VVWLSACADVVFLAVCGCCGSGAASGGPGGGTDGGDFRGGLVPRRPGSGGRLAVAQGRRGQYRDGSTRAGTSEMCACC